MVNFNDQFAKGDETFLKISRRHMDFPVLCPGCQVVRVGVYQNIFVGFDVSATAVLSKKKRGEKHPSSQIFH